MARTVLIVDDHARFRAVAQALLRLEGLEAVGEAADALSAMEAVGRLRPNCVSGLSGLEPFTRSS